MNIKWTDATRARLRRAWEDGVSLAAIAHELHCTPPAIVSQASRMELPSRTNRPPSRVTSEAEHASAKALALSGVKPLQIATQTGLGVSVAYRIAQQNKPTEVLPSVALKPLPALQTPVPRVAFTPPPRTVAVVPVVVRGSCQWPIGDPRSKAFRFCGKNSMPDRPYCAEHCSVAYGRRAP